MKLIDALFAKFIVALIKDHRWGWIVWGIHIIGFFNLGWYYCLVYLAYGLYTFSFGVRYGEWYTEQLIADVLSRKQ